MSVTYSQVSRDGENRRPAGINSSPDSGGICCPESQVQRDFWGMKGRGYTAHGGKTWNLTLVVQSQLGMIAPSFPTPNTAKGMG